MKNRSHPWFRTVFIRNAELDTYAELFLVNTVLSIMIIRVYLKLTQYPQIAPGGLHIAHMLWGGLLMFVAIAMLLFFLDTHNRYLAAIIGGLGFGTFIDELGKFLTADNNYFFQPTFALIYIILILFYLFSRWIDESKPLSRIEYLMNAIELLQAAAIGDMDIRTRERIMNYIKHARLPATITHAFQTLSTELLQTARKQPDRYTQLKNTLRTQYRTLMRRKTLQTAVAILFIIKACWAILTAGFWIFLLIAKPQWSTPSLSIETVLRAISTFGFFDWGNLISTIAADAIIVWGLLKIRVSYAQSLIWFRRSVVFSILVVQFFALYHDQLSAVVGVVGDIILLYALRYMIAQQKNIFKIHEISERRR